MSELALGKYKLIWTSATCLAKMKSKKSQKPKVTASWRWEGEIFFYFLFARHVAQGT
jgi:hypothetical protein